MALVGQTLGGRYTMLSLLGEGGMGVVYKAHDESTGKDVAVKVLSEALLHDDDATARFEREAQALFGLAHPNILKVHDFGKLGARPYLVMDLLSGKGLDELVEEHEGLPLEMATDLFRQILNGLAHAHSKGAAHRDLKTENIHVCPKGHVTLMDFGLVKFTDSQEWGDAEKLTRMGAVFGTPAYMAPEQCAGAPADERSDVYAAGVILYEMLTGAWPFMEESRMKMFQAHLAKPVPSINAYGQTPKAMFDVVVARAMEKFPEKRYGSAGEMLEHFNQIAVGGPPAGVTTTPGTSEDLATPTESKSNLLPLILVAAVLLLALIAAVVFIL